jgi:hypothetical protein
MIGRKAARGGLISGPPLNMDLKVKLSEGRHYYWEPEAGRWVRIVTPTEGREFERHALEMWASPEQELADDYQRNEHR